MYVITIHQRYRRTDRRHGRTDDDDILISISRYASRPTCFER